MNIEKTITINNQEVLIRYCAATETGFETISGKSSTVFIPRVEYDEEGNVAKVEPPEATVGDFIALALAGITASYTMRKEKPPVASEYILYEATPEEVKLLTTTIVTMRNEWYQVPSVIQQDKPTEDDKKNGRKRKNA